MIGPFFKEFVLNYMTNIRKIPDSLAENIVVGRKFLFFEDILEE